MTQLLGKDEFRKLRVSRSLPTGLTQLTPKPDGRRFDAVAFPGDGH